jgi:hypothetical protein
MLGTAPNPGLFQQPEPKRSTTMYIGIGGIILLIIVLVLIF